MNKYFIAANTAEGFENWSEEILPAKAFDRVYLLKGGSGTGKSTLMKRIGGMAEGVTWYHCSAAPDSLDAISFMAGGKKIAVMDATSPHIREPHYVGAVDEIVNLGAFLNTEELEEYRDEITVLTEKKEEKYRRAYRYLAVCGRIRRLCYENSARTLDFDKMNAAVGRIFDKAMKNGVTERRIHGAEMTLPVSAISTQGSVHFDSYEHLGKVRYAVTDVNATAVHFFRACVEEAKKRGLEIIRGAIPLLPEYSEALYVIQIGLVFVTTDKTSEEFKNVNMARFYEPTREEKQEYRRLSKASDSVYDMALHELSEAGRFHAELERIYSAAMNFDGLNRYTEALIQRIFG